MVRRRVRRPQRPENGDGLQVHRRLQAGSRTARQKLGRGQSPRERLVRKRLRARLVGRRQRHRQQHHAHAVQGRDRRPGSHRRPCRGDDPQHPRLPMGRREGDPAKNHRSKPVEGGGSWLPQGIQMRPARDGPRAPLASGDLRIPVLHGRRTPEKPIPSRTIRRIPPAEFHGQRRRTRTMARTQERMDGGPSGAGTRSGTPDGTEEPGIQAQEVASRQAHPR